MQDSMCPDFFPTDCLVKSSVASALTIYFALLPTNIRARFFKTGCSEASVECTFVISENKSGYCGSVA